MGVIVIFTMKVEEMDSTRYKFFSIFHTGMKPTVDGVHQITRAPKS